MYRVNKIELVIPAHDEERLIGPTLDGALEIIDRIYVIDDASKDRTAEVVENYGTVAPRVELIQHETNKGIDQGIHHRVPTGQQGRPRCHRSGRGGNQMPIKQIEDLLKPIIDGQTDFTSGTKPFNSACLNFFCNKEIKSLSHSSFEY